MIIERLMNMPDLKERTTKEQQAINDAKDMWSVTAQLNELKELLESQPITQEQYGEEWSAAEQIKEFKQLLYSCVITPAEYNALKTKIIGDKDDARK